MLNKSAEQLSHVTERERLAREAVRESQEPRRNVDHVSDEETELPQQPSQTSGQENNVAPVSPSEVPVPDPVPPETPDENAATSNDDRENTAEPCPAQQQFTLRKAARVRRASSGTWRLCGDVTMSCCKKTSNW